MLALTRRAGRCGRGSCGRRVPATQEDVRLSAGSSAVRPVARRRACATRGASVSLTLALTLPGARPRVRHRVGLHAAPWTRARSCCKRPAARSLARRGRSPEPPRRGRAARVPRGRGRGAPHRPCGADGGPDAPHRLRRARRPEAGSRRRSSTSSRTPCASRVATIPGVSVLFTTPLGMRHRRGTRRHAGGHLGAHLRTGPRRARPAGRRGAARSSKRIDGIADLRVEQLSGLPQLRVTVDRDAAARVGLTPGE